MKPTLHREFQIDERVKFDVGPGVERSGTITGIAFQHVIFSYIITLDEPLYVPEHDKPWTTVVMPGGCLR
jgi:hypothetical protein